jgi:PKD repeat protein
MKRASRLAAVGSLLTLALISCEQPTESPVAPIQADVALGPPTYFADRATFVAQFPDLPLEDFEEGRVADGGVVACPGPLDATSDNRCFLPGEIQAGVRFNSALPAEGAEIALVGRGFVGATSKNIVAGEFVDVFIIDFTEGNVTAAGMDLVAYFVNDMCQIDIFGQSGLISSTSAPCTNAGTFWGVSSDEIITRIRISSPAGQAEGVDNISFGGGVVPPVNHSPLANAAGPYSAREGSAVLFDGSASFDPDGDQLTFDWDFGDGTEHGTGVQPSHTYADNRPGGYPVTLTVRDGGGLVGTASTTADVENVAPAVGPIDAPVHPQVVGTPVTAAASFTDPGILDTHTGMIDWGDGTSSQATVTEANGSGSVSGSHAYAANGVYTLTLTVTDKDGGAGRSVFEFVVVFDLEAGFVTGGGWIDSPPGSYLADAGLVGRATFGFVSKYGKGATVPTGNTEFNFHVGDLRFGSTSYDWLVVSGSKARFKGSGTINGAGDFSFLVSVVDGDVTGDGPDTFRIKITDKATGIVVYDSERERGDGTAATTVLAGGSIVIHH